jgi:hypothetical protein
VKTLSSDLGSFRGRAGETLNIFYVLSVYLGRGNAADRADGFLASERRSCERRANDTTLVTTLTSAF